MKYELVGVFNGAELYNPVPEDKYEEQQIKMNEERFCSFLADMILKYWPQIEANLENK